MTAELVMITRFSDDGEVVEWFRVLRESRDAAGDPAEFPALLRERASSFDEATVEEFLRALAETGDAERALGELVELESQMPDLYWSYHPRAEEAPAEESPFDWVDDDQATRLAAAWGGDWQAHLGDQLTARWGENWAANPADHKHAWLTDLLPELLDGTGSPSGDADTDPFGWVLEDHAHRLTEAWGGDWQTHLGDQLTARWGEGWQANPADHKQAWLTDLLPELLPDTATEAAAVPAAVEQEVSAILDELLEEELAALDADSDLSADELGTAVAELRAELLGTSATQEG